ncbi:MAG: glycosyltransferase family 87 protein [Chloroflexota bacterium]
MRSQARPFGHVDWAAIAFVTLSALGGVVLLWAITSVLNSTHGLGFDTRAYWGYPRDEVYSPLPTLSAGYGFYRYSPVFVPLMTLWTAIPWPVFVTAWFAVGVVLYVWMVGPWALALLAIPVFAVELFIGNVHLLLALAIVLGFRWPAAWSFVLLTKVTPGVGLLWFAVRREWRSLAIALGVTAAIAAVSLALTPDLWAEWLRSLTQTSEPGSGNTVAIPLPYRVVAAAVLVVWGARTDRRWTVVVAATISIPVLWLNGLAMLAGVVALHRGFPERLHGQFDWLAGLLRGRGTQPTIAPTPHGVAR